MIYAYLYIVLISEVLEHPFLQPRQAPIDHLRPRNRFIDCTTYLKQPNKIINYGVFKGIFNRPGKPKPLRQPGVGGTGRGHRLGVTQPRPPRRGSCIKNCLRFGKPIPRCRNVCRCRARCKREGHRSSKCRRICKKKFNQNWKRNWTSECIMEKNVNSLIYSY